MSSLPAVEPLRCRTTAYPVLHPHAVAAEDALAFLGACDGSTRFDEILAGHDVTDAVAEALGEVVWLERPVAGEPAAAGARTLILCAAPHAGWLAMGGHLLAQRHTARPLSVCCFISVAYDDGEDVRATPFEAAMTAHDEGDFCAQITGTETCFLDIPDQASRAALASGTFEESERAVRASLRLMLQHLITVERPTDVFAPAALSNDPDERLLFEIALEIFEDAFFAGTRFHLYEDVPAAGIQVDDFLARFESSYLDVAPWHADVTEQLEQKAVLVDVFRSTCGPAEELALRSAAARNAEWDGRDAAAHERFWTLRLAMPDPEGL